MCWTPGPPKKSRYSSIWLLRRPSSRLVDRELDLPVTARHHLGHERGVLGGDVLVGEVDHLGHAHRLLVVLDPVVHTAELDVADDMVDRS